MASPGTDPRSPQGVSGANDTGSNDDNDGTNNRRRRRPPGENESEDGMDGTEMGSSVNEMAEKSGADAQIAKDAAEAAELRANSQPKSPTKARSKASSKAKSKAQTKPLETIEDEGISMDFDKEPEPIPTFGSTGGAFPGVECTTVAILSARGGGYKYINRYGPETCPWFVIADTAHGLPDDKSEDELLENEILQCVTDCNSRKIDFPHKQTAKNQKVKKEDIKGILYAVADIEHETQCHPLKMIESLNPATVKKTGEYKDLKSRQRAAKENKVDKYPSTYLLLQFRKDVHPNNHFRKDRSWELSSKFRALQGTKSQLSTEQTIYQTVKNRAERFLAWYKARQPKDFKRFEELAQNIPAVERTPSKSPEPTAIPRSSKSPEPVVKIKEEPKSPQAVDTIAPQEGEPERVASSTPQAGAGDDDDDEEEGEVVLTPEQEKKQSESAWKMLNNIAPDKALSKSQKAEFNFWYKLVNK